jgi:hypothetical protein
VIYSTSKGFPPVETPNKPRIYLNDVPVTSLGINLTSPRGREKYNASGVRFIDWTSAVPVGSVGNVKLELSITGMSGPWSVIAPSLPNSGRYQWTVPKTPSKNCYIRATITTGSGIAKTTNPVAFEILGSGGPPVTEAGFALIIFISYVSFIAIFAIAVRYKQCT